VPGPVLSPGRLRAMYRSADVHIWADADDVLMAGCGYAALHAASNGDKCLVAPESATWTDVCTGEVLAVQTRTLRRTLQRGETLVCRID
jgi:hypothetical protein